MERLEQLLKAFLSSNFAKKKRFIGSSLLFVGDEKNASIWMIDFAKTTDTGKTITHDKMWVPGNEEDGYLIGIYNLIKIFKELIAEAGAK